MKSAQKTHPSGTPKKNRKNSKKAGLSPGSVVFVGEQKVAATTLRVVDYSASHCDEREIQSIDECFPLLASPSCTWVVIEGLQDIDMIKRIGHHVGLHSLLLEDIVNTSQRPRIEGTDDHLFCVLKGLRTNRDTGMVAADQVTLVVGQNYVISFQEIHEEAFDAVLNRIRTPQGQHRRAGADYLAYSLLDALVDYYFGPLEVMADQLESLEQVVVDNPRPEALRQIHRLKRDVVMVRKTIWPMREVVAGLRRIQSSIMTEATRPYLADVYDHTVQVMETTESLRDVIGSLLDTYLSSVSNRMNEVMKVLTLIATVFIPLTFLAGVYGMNFDHMPELHWAWFYPVGFWIAIGGTIVAMVALFRWKRWI